MDLLVNFADLKASALEAKRAPCKQKKIQVPPVPKDTGMHAGVYGYRISDDYMEMVLMSKEFMFQVIH